MSQCSISILRERIRKSGFLMFSVGTVMEHLLEMVHLVSSQIFFYHDFSVLQQNHEPLLKVLYTLKKQELPLPPNPSKIDYYKNSDELCNHVTKLSLPSHRKINCSNTVQLYKTDPIYENPVVDIFVGDTCNFII